MASASFQHELQLLEYCHVDDSSFTISHELVTGHVDIDNGGDDDNDYPLTISGIHYHHNVTKLCEAGVA
jgi:hypothetical protein